MSTPQLPIPNFQVHKNERRNVRIAALALAAVSILACGRSGPSSGPIALTVPGKSTATPWVAASGSFVAVAFGATSADGKQFPPRIRIPTLESPKPSHPQIVVAGGRVVVAWEEMNVD